MFDVRRPWSRLVALAIPLTSLGGAHAAAADGARGIALDEAVHLAESAAPAALVQEARARAAEAEVGVAGALRNPQVLVGTTTASAQFVGGASISVPLFGQRGAAIDAARAGAHAAAVEAAVGRADVRLAATVAWVDLWLAEREIALAREDGARFERLRAAAEDRFEQGAAPRIDVLRAKADAHRARAAASALEAQRDAISSQLAALVGRDPAAPLATTGEPRSAPREAAVSVAQHPLVARTRARLSAADAVVSRERRARWPLLSFSIQEWYQARNPDTRGFLTVDVPLFDGPSVDRAVLQARAARVEADAARVDAEAEVVRVRALFNAADRRCKSAVDDVLPVAKETADLAEEAYQDGALDLTTTLAAAQSLSAAKLTAARAIAERARAAATLDRLAGRLR